jgi:hypothetical protein
MEYQKEDELNTWNCCEDSTWKKTCIDLILQDIIDHKWIYMDIF